MSEPTFELEVNGDAYEMNRQNASLFTFMGELAMYNHIFLVHENDGTHAIGTYVWSRWDIYKTLAHFMVDNHFTMHLNMPVVGQTDIDAFDRGIEAEAAHIEEEIEGEDGE